MRTKTMKQIDGVKNEMTKEQELEEGRKVQSGLDAEVKLENRTSLSDEEISELENIAYMGQLAQEHLFETHIKLATDRAKWMSRQTGTRYSIDDLKQDAYYALSLAIKTYDPSHNCRLSTHAFRRITKALSVSINKMRPVRLPENRMGDYLHITKAEAEYLREKRGDVDPAEMQAYVMEKTGLSKVIITTIKSAISGTVSMNAPLGDEGGEFGDLLPDTKLDEAPITSEALLEIFCNLSQEEQDILVYEYGVGTPSIPIDKYMRSNNVDKVGITKKAKEITRNLKRKHNKKKTKDGGAN